MFASRYMWGQKAWEQLTKTYGTAPASISNPGRDLSQAHLLQ